MKIAFIGAGSFGFTRALARDILTFPALAGCELALMDINAERLAYITRAVEKLIAESGAAAAVTSTQDRAEALDGADGVLITILAGDVAVWRHDVEIPKKYGVDINVGDTRGPSGVFRFLRTAPVMLDIARDIEKYAPGAIVLNYTNPMAMLCRVLQSETSLRVSGLCHSVQGTAHMLAGWLGADFDADVSYLCAGINHQAFYLEYKVRGQDAYPALREIVRSRPEVYAEEIVRNEMFLHLDYYPTESSGHNSEYNAWFRKRPELIERYCHPGTGWNPGRYAYIRDEYLAREDTWRADIERSLAEPANLARGREYAAYIFNACFGDHTPFVYNGNTRNFGLIDNLPAGACVEVPVLASREGLMPAHVGPLPPQLAALCGLSAQCEEMAAQGYLEHDRRKIFHSILHDPLTAAVCSMAEIAAMTEEMFAANERFLTI
jgi:alpha-galactosidase